MTKAARLLAEHHMYSSGVNFKCNALLQKLTQLGNYSGEVASPLQQAHLLAIQVNKDCPAHPPLSSRSTLLAESKMILSKESK